MSTKSFLGPPQPPGRKRVIRGSAKKFAVSSQKRERLSHSAWVKRTVERALVELLPHGGSGLPEERVDPSKPRHTDLPADLASTAYRPDARARAILKGVVVAQTILKSAGGAFELEDVRTLLMGVSRQAISKRVADGSLIAVPGPQGRRVYPTVQFNPGGTIVDGLKAVQDALPTRNAWTVLSFLAEPESRLGGRAPIELLREGNVDLVVEAARRYGEQGA